MELTIHNAEVGGSSPPVATIEINASRGILRFLEKQQKTEIPSSNRFLLLKSKKRTKYKS